MPKIPTPLTDREIKSLKPKDKVYKKCDGKGLYIFIEPNGRKYFALEYKSPLDNKIKRINLGDYPAFTLKMARDERDKVRQKVRDGIDIKLENKLEADTIFKNLAKRWLDIKATSLTPNYIKKQHQMLELHIYPYIGDRDIRTIKESEVIEILKRPEKEAKFEFYF